MAQALIVDFESDFDPTLPVDLHPLGVGGYANRYVADTLGEAPGAVLGSWKDSVGSLALVAAANDQRPVVGSLNGFKYISFDGVATGLKGSYTADAIKSVVMVVRPTVPSANSVNVLFAGGVNLSKNTASAASEFLYQGTNMPTTAAGTFPSDKWSILVATVDGLNSTITVNGNAQTTNASGAPTGKLYQYAIGRDGAAIGKFDVAELVGYPQILTPTERATVLTNLQSRYAPII